MLDRAFALETITTTVSQFSVGVDGHFLAIKQTEPIQFVSQGQIASIAELLLVTTSANRTTSGVYSPTFVTMLTNRADRGA